MCEKEKTNNDMGPGIIMWTLSWKLKVDTYREWSRTAVIGESHVQL